MTFKKYSSLENVKQNLIEFLIIEGYSSISYAVTEKVHGANFGIHLLEGTELRFSRRNGFLSEEDSFYNYQNLDNDFTASMQYLYSLFPACKSIRVFGEIFGGSLDGYTPDKQAKQVQKEVKYSPNNEFMAFDLQVDDIPIPFLGARKTLLDAGIKAVPLLGVTENLEQALQFNNSDNSLIPALLGYEVEGINTKEGNVIIPAKEVIFLNNGKRLVLKDKNEKFKEKKEAKVVREEIDLPEDHKALMSEVMSYITDKRLNNVLSKEVDNLKSSDFGRVVGLLVKDVLEEFNNDHNKNVKEELSESWKRASKVINKQSQTVVRKHFVDNIF